VHKHLRRLERVWLEHPIYFVTTCTHSRKSILTSREVAEILVDEWTKARNRHGWAIGRYVIMPEHVHFFCGPELGAKPLAAFVGFWKQWTSKRIKRVLGLAGPVWQEQFFDHVLRSGESYSQKWQYVRENPMRADLVENADDWPWQGEIEDLRL
jgi:REP element-mobilizing transposase RayT